MPLLIGEGESKEMNIERPVDLVLNQGKRLECLFPTSRRLINLATMSMLSGQDLMVVGPPGVGKSRVLHEYSSLLPEGTVFTYGCQSRTTAGHLLGMEVIEERLSGKDVIKEDKMCRASLAVLEEAGDLPTDVIRDAMLPAADTPKRKVQLSQYSFNPLFLERLHAIWYTSNFDRKDPALEAWMDRTLFQFVAKEVTESTGRNKILLRAGISMNNIDRLSEDDLSKIRHLTSPDTAGVVVPYWLLKANDQLLMNVSEKWPKGCEGDGRRPPVSTRALFQAITLLKASALSRGRYEVNLDDLESVRYFAKLTEEVSQTEDIINGEIDRLKKYFKSPQGRKEAVLVDAVMFAERLLLIDECYRTDRRLKISSLVLPSYFRGKDKLLPSPKLLISYLESAEVVDNPVLNDRRIKAICDLKRYSNGCLLIDVGQIGEVGYYDVKI